MPVRSDKRVRLMDAAERLFHHHGYTKTSIQDVAKAAGVPTGNVFYWFRTKQALLGAVVERRNGQVRERHQAFAQAPDPAERLRLFLQRIADGADWRAEHGCPMGGLCQETNKLGGAEAETAASTLKISLGWLKEQYRALGRTPKAAQAEATALMGAVQGAILLCHSLRDPELLRSEMKRLQAALRKER